MSTSDFTGRHMPPWLPRAFMLAAATLAVFVAGIWVLLRLRGLLLLLLISLFLALAIEPAVNKLAVRGWRRGLATGLMFSALGVFAALFFAVLGSLLIGQVTTMIREIPEYVKQLVTWTNQVFHTDLSQVDIDRQVRRAGGMISSHWSDLAGNALGIGTTALGALFQSFATLLFAFYLSAQGPRFRRTVCSLLPPQQQREVLRAWEIAVDKTGGYIYSRILLAVVSAIAHCIVLWLLGVPFAFALGLWVGVVSQLIPTIGTYLAGLLPVLVALSKSPLTTLWVLVFIIAYQQFENYVLHPHVTAKTVDMHPAVAFGAVIAGAALIGPIGALLAIPAGASLHMFTKAYVRRYEVEEHPLTTSGSRAESAKSPGRRSPRWHG